jgi:hypothetical protein
VNLQPLGDIPTLRTSVAAPPLSLDVKKSDNPGSIRSHASTLPRSSPALPAFSKSGQPPISMQQNPIATLSTFPAQTVTATGICFYFTLSL